MIKLFHSGVAFWWIVDLCGLLFIYCKLCSTSHFYKKGKSKMDSWTLSTNLWVLIGTALILLELFKVVSATPILIGLATASVVAAFVSYYFSNFSLQIIAFLFVLLLFCSRNAMHYGTFL